MNWKLSLACLLALTGVSAGCATTTTTTDPTASYHPGTSPHALYPRTDAPQIDNSDAAGPGSIPGTMTGAAPAVIAPAPAASPVILVPPAAETPVIVVPPGQPR